MKILYKRNPMKKVIVVENSDIFRVVIKRIREDYNLTQAKLGDMTGTNKAVISSYENKVATVSVNLFIKILAVAGYRLEIRKIEDSAVPLPQS
jgi:transcriptional regulator with XRE-family HTH domain